MQKCESCVDERLICMCNIKSIGEYVNNAKNYKPARKKEYCAWACIPPINTLVYNKLENAQYRTGKDAEVVISGTQGEQFVISLDNFCKHYKRADGAYITKDTLNSMCDKNCCVDWFVVKPVVKKSILWACFVPKVYQFEIRTAKGTMLHGNNSIVEHGAGDFIIAADCNGRPNGYDRWIVNGAVFASTYDNRGWQNCIDPQCVNNGSTPPKPACLFKNEKRKYSTGSRTLSALQREEMECFIQRIMASAVSSEYASYILSHEIGDENTFVDEVVSDILSTSAWEEEGYYNEDDVRLAIGRVFMDQLKIEI